MSPGIAFATTPKKAGITLKKVSEGEISDITIGDDEITERHQELEERATL